MAEEQEVLTAEEAAALLRVSTKTVLALARAGSLHGEKVGRAWRFVRTTSSTTCAAQGHRRGMNRMAGRPQREPTGTANGWGPSLC